MASDMDENHDCCIHSLRIQLLLRLCQAVSQAPLSNWNLPHTPTQVSKCSLEHHKTIFIPARCLTSRQCTAWKQIASSPTCLQQLMPPGTTLDLHRLVFQLSSQGWCDTPINLRSVACLTWWGTAWCHSSKLRSRCFLFSTLLALSSKDSMLTGEYWSI